MHRIFLSLLSLIGFTIAFTFFIVEKLQADIEVAPEITILSHIGGANFAVAVENSIAYIGAGPRITTVDVSNPTNPIYVASSAILSDTVKEITLVGTYAYISAGAGGFYIADVSDPSSPSIVGRYDSPGTAKDVRIRGNYAYLADHNSLKILQISNPANPTEINSVSLGADRLVISGDLLYVVGGQYIRVLDVSNPLNILTLGYYDVSPQSIYGIQVVGSYAYLAVRDGLQILDVSNPASIQPVSTYLSGMSTQNIVVAGSYAYLARYGGMTVLDITTPSDPQLISNYTTMSNAYDIQVIGGLAYLADEESGLRLINTVNPENPQELGFYSTLGDLRQIVATENLLYLVNSGTAWAEFWIMDISVPQNPQRIGYRQIPAGDKGMTVSGNYAYFPVANGATGFIQDVLILNVENPYLPVEAGLLTIDTTNSISDLVVVGHYLYVLEYHNGIRIFNISDPADPVYHGFYSMDNSPSLYNITVSGNYAYVADGQSGNGLRILDISDPAVPWQVYTLILTRNYSSAAAISGDYAYVKNGDYFSVVDVTNPTTPVALTHTHQYWMPAASELFGYAVCDGCRSTGSTLILFEGSTEIASLDFRFHGTRGIAAEGTRVYMAGIDGLFIVQIGDIPPIPDPPIAPSNLNAIAVSESRIDLNWTDNSNNESGFKIERSPDGSNWAQIGTVAVNDTNYQDTGLICDTLYFYRVRAYNTSGDSSYSVNRSETTSTCPSVLPAAPSNLNVTAVSKSQINLAWTDNDDNENGFKIERSPTGNGNWIQIGTTGINESGYLDTNLTCGTTYYYRVRAFNSSGDSNYSNTASTSTSTCLSTGDPYEPDNNCTQAGTIPINGLVQEHTFHQQADEDWVVFQAMDSTQYRIEAQIPPGSPADVTLELFSQCAGIPLETQNYTFAPGVRLEFEAKANGPIYLRWTNSDSNLFGESVAYHLSVRKLEQEASPGALIIAAGKLKSNDILQPNIHYVANQVYQLFQGQGYDADRIYYLATDLSLPGVDALATASNLQAALTNWAGDKVGLDRPLTLYLVDHGDADKIYLDKSAGQWITPTQLDNWLSQLETAHPGLKVNIIVEACQSGSFMSLPQTISKHGRVVIASTGSTNLAYASSQGAVFSDHFTAALGQGQSLYQSFQTARWATQAAYPHQTPWLDDNGNNIANEQEDGMEAGQRGFAFSGTLADESWPPYIMHVQEPTEIENGQGILRSQVRDDERVKRVWAVIYPPSYQPPLDGEELVNEIWPTIVLQNQGNEEYAATYTGFDEMGVYRVVVHAEDDNGLEARPVLIEMRTGWEVYLPMVLR